MLTDLALDVDVCHKNPGGDAHRSCCMSPLSLHALWGRVSQSISHCHFPLAHIVTSMAAVKGVRAFVRFLCKCTGWQGHMLADRPHQLQLCHADRLRSTSMMQSPPYWVVPHCMKFTAQYMQHTTQCVQSSNACKQPVSQQCKSSLNIKHCRSLNAFQFGSKGPRWECSCTRWFQMTVVHVKVLKPKRY